MVYPPHLFRILALLTIAALALPACRAGASAPAATEAEGGAETTIGSAEEMAFEDIVVRIEDAKCYIGFAAVKLSVGELEPRDGKLVGEYRIRVPLRQSKNDRGRIVLPFDASLRELGENGGTLRGKAFSDNKDDPPHTIVCEIHPLNKKTIRLAITTSKRTLEFDSTYSLIRRDGKGG